MRSAFLYTSLLILLALLFFQCKTLGPVSTLPDTALQEAQTLTAGAWQKLLKNEFQSALSDFNSALEKKPEYLPAGRGSGLAYYTQAREFESFDKLFDVAAANPADPLSVAILQFIEAEIPFRKSLMKQLYTHYQKLADNSKLPYWIRRFACDRLVKYALEYFMDQKTTVKYASRLANLKGWMITGPFSNVSHSAVLNESAPDFLSKVKNAFYSSFSGKDNMDLKSMLTNSEYEALDGWIYLSQYLDFPRESAVYASKTFSVDKDSEYLFIVSRQGALKFWLDDKLLVNDPVYKTGTDLHWIKAPVAKGTHNLVLQLSNQYEPLAFRVSMLDLNSKATWKTTGEIALPDFSVAPAAIPGITGTLIQDPLLYSLAQTLAGNPGDAENYFWSSWLLNNRGDGKAGLELAQSSLAAFSQTVPGDQDQPAPPLVFQYLKAVSLLKSNNYIDARNLLIKITSAKEIFAPASAFVISDYVDHQHYEKASALIKRVTEINPNWYYAPEGELLIIMAMENKEEALTKLEALIKRYGGLYPDAPGLFSTYLSRSSTIDALAGSSGNYYQKMAAAGMPLLANVLEMKMAYRNEDFARAYYLARLITGIQPYNIEAWEILVPSQLKQTGQLDTTRKLCRKLLIYFPNNIFLLNWEMEIAEDYKAVFKEKQKISDARLDQAKIRNFLKNENASWKLNAQQLLNLIPENFTLRTELRLFNNEKAFAEIYKTPVLENIIAEFEQKEQTWKGDAVIVLDDTTELFFGKGASRSYHYYILKVLSENGVIGESTQELYYNPHNSELDIMQAFLLKPDGSTIDAIRRGNMLSYQGLQSGDYLVYYYSVNHFESGELNNQYWTSCQFNAYYPVNKVSFRLLLPKSLKLNVVQHNVEHFEITVNRNPFDLDFEQYIYTAENIPAVAIESHMPASLDLFAWMDFSTLTDWQPVVQWYEHLATGQAEVTYKIREKTAELINGVKSRDDQIKNIYDFVSQKIKYEDLNFQYSAYKPQRAESVLSDGYGDCKDKASLLITMLKAAGIASYIALNTPDYAGKNFFLPSTRFIHAIVVVPGEEGAKDLILDPTSEYFTYPDLPAESIGSAYLVIKPGNTELSRIPEPATRGKTLLLTGLKSEDQTSSLDGSLLYNNSQAGEVRALLFTTDAEFKDKLFSTLFNYDIPGFQLDSVEYSNLYTLKDDPRIDFKATIPAPIRDYENRMAVLELPWLVGLPVDLRPALSEQQRQSPVLFKFSSFANPVCQTIYYSIPGNYKVISLPGNLEYDFPGAGYIRYTFELKGNQLVASRDFYLPFLEVAGEDLPQLKETFLLAMQKEEEKIILQK